MSTGVATPHFKVPFQIGPDGYAETVEQGSIDEIGQCVEALLLTTVGERIEVPTFGVPPLLFTQVPGGWSKAALAAVDRWEPRARVAIGQEIDSLDELTTHLNVEIAPVNRVDQ